MAREAGRVMIGAEEIKNIVFDYTEVLPSDGWLDPTLNPTVSLRLVEGKDKLEIGSMSPSGDQATFSPQQANGPFLILDANNQPKPGEGAEGRDTWRGVKVIVAIKSTSAKVKDENGRDTDEDFYADGALRSIWKVTCKAASKPGGFVNTATMKVFGRV